MLYNQKTSIARCDVPYQAMMGENSVKGSSIVYDAKNRKVQSKNVTIQYNLKEE